MAVRKPRKVPTASQPKAAAWGVSASYKAPQGLGSRLKMPTAAAPRPPAAPTPPKPVIPATTPVPTQPPVGSGPPPATPQSASDRITLGQNWDTSRTSINRQLAEALRAYGGEGMQQRQVDASGALVDAGPSVQDPNSAMATLMRNLGIQSEAQNVNANAQNNFFSGFNQKAQQDLTDQNNRDKEAAFTAYQQALGTLTDQLSGARTDWQTGLRNADIADAEAANANQPDPRDAAPAASGAPPGPAPGTLAHAQLAGGTAFAGLQQGQQYKTDSKGRLVVYNPTRKMWVLA